MARTTSDHRGGIVRMVVIAAVVAAASSAAPAMAANEAHQGQQVLQRLQAGNVSCSSLKTEDFDHVGEYVMERMLGSASAHQAMNRQMAAMMGDQGETQAHVYMGQRFAGCATRRAPNAFGAMMGMMGAGMMGSVYGGGDSSMMGSRSGGMMGFGSSGASDRSDGWSGADTVMVVLMGLLIALVLGTLVTLRRARAGDDALTALQRRFAGGEIDQEEYDRCRQALGATP